jgi:hypothetical protein
MAAMIAAEDIEMDANMAVDEEEYDEEEVDDMARPNFPALSAADASVRLFILSHSYLCHPLLIVSTISK